MSSAHRPTWTPAQGKEVTGASRQFSTRDMAAQTKLKFRQPGQTSASDVQKRDLRAELLAAEKEARERKRKAGTSTAVIDGLSVAELENGDESVKRRKLLQEALDLDKDDDDDEEGGEKKANGEENGSDEEEEEDSDDEEDDTAELLRELEKIKRERAEEKARLEAEESSASQAENEARIATGNPLLNLQAALGQAPTMANNTGGTFAVKRRWDDDLIFKNQATGASDKPSGQFVNDLLRTEFHRKFMHKFIK